MLKWGFITVAGLIILGIIIGISTGGGDKAEEATNKAQTEHKQAKETQAKPEKQKKEKKADGKVTREKYEQIKIGDALDGKGGMSQDEVKKILGEPQDVTSTESGDMKMDTWTYNAKGDFGAMVTVTFSNGKTSGKSQFGLEK